MTGCEEAATRKIVPRPMRKAISATPAQPSSSPVSARPAPSCPVRRIWPRATWPRTIAGMVESPAVNGCATPQASEATASELSRFWAVPYRPVLYRPGPPPGNCAVTCSRSARVSLRARSVQACSVQARAAAGQLCGHLFQVGAGGHGVGVVQACVVFVLRDPALGVSGLEYLDRALPVSV